MTFRVDARTRQSFSPAFDAAVAEVFRTPLFENSEVWNVGANVGVHVLQLCHLVGPRGRVVAFEPNPYAVELLRRNVSLNGFRDRVEIMAAAVGERLEEVELFVSGTDPMARAGKPNPSLPCTEPIRVPSLTLDHVWQTHGTNPRGLLMDIEGWEIAALMSSRRMLSVAASSIVLVVELHPDAWKWSGHSRDQLEALLAELSLEAIPITGQRDALGEHGHVLLRRRQAGVARSGSC